MSLSPRPARLIDVWRALCSGEAGVGLRVAVSLVSGLLLCGCGSGGAWLIALFSDRVGISRRSYFYVRDEHLAISFAIAAGAWCLVLGWVWGRTRRGRLPIRPLAGTVVAGLAAIAGSVAMSELVPREEEYLIGALILAAGAIAMVLWLPTIHGWRRGRSVMDAEDEVNVDCPDCGYSMRGLTSTCCPECGARFTLDELIRAQQYEATSSGNREFEVGPGPVAGPPPDEAPRVSYYRKASSSRG